jgi:hypothetical protein
LDDGALLAPDRGMIKNTKVEVALAVTAVFALFACEHEEPAQTSAANAQYAPINQTSPGVTNMQPLNIDDSVFRSLATASCNHELSCGDLGERSGALDACVSKAQARVQSELTAYGCSMGLAPAALDQCTTALLGGACHVAQGSLATHPDCRSDALCMKPGQTPTTTR